MRAAGGACLALVAVLLVAAGPQPPAPRRDGTLEAIDRELQRLRDRIGRFDQEESGILGSLERLSMERLLLEEEIRRLRLEAGARGRAVEETRQRITEIEARLAEGRRILSASLREAYKLGRLRGYRAILEAEDAVELARTVRYLGEWVDADSRRVQAFVDGVAELESSRRSLEGRLDEIERLRQEGERRRAALERNRNARLEALRRLGEERAAGTAAVKELEEAAGRLEALVASLPAGRPVPIDGRLVDLYRFRGHLPWPVAGTIQVGFGKIRDARFGTQVPHPGIDIEVPEGTPVHPIFGGRVAFADWFRGYGNTVMVDHGGGLLSVYAHLRSLDVNAAEQVDPGVPLGLSGSTGSLRGALVYLEIREGGKAVDPTVWLAPEPLSR